MSNHSLLPLLFVDKILLSFFGDPPSIYFLLPLKLASFHFLVFIWFHGVYGILLCVYGILLCSLLFPFASDSVTFFSLPSLNLNFTPDFAALFFPSDSYPSLENDLTPLSFTLFFMSFRFVFFNHLALKPLIFPSDSSFSHFMLTVLKKKRKKIPRVLFILCEIILN